MTLTHAPKPLEKTTRRLVVRPMRLDDYDAWHAAMSAREPALHRFDPGRLADDKLTRDAFEEKVYERRQLQLRDLQYIFGVFHRKTGAHLGSVDLLILTRLHTQVANLGYQIHNTQWRKGYAREAVNAVIELAFRRLFLHRLEAGIEPGNKASLALARSIGMKRERLSRSYLFDGDRWLDLVFYVLVPEDRGIKSQRPSVRTRLGE